MISSGFPKVVRFVRHGQSEHNLVYDAEGRDPMIFDAPLTELGREQARSLRSTVRPTLLDDPPQLIVTSPLRRAIETCLLAFPPSEHRRRTSFEVWPEATERLEAACDVGTDADQLAAAWPELDFSALSSARNGGAPGAPWWYVPPDEHDDDDGGVADDSRERFATYGFVEPTEVLENRVDRLMRRLRQRPETHVVVVGHADTTNCLLRRHFGIDDKWLDNCELCTVRLHSRTDEHGVAAAVVSDETTRAKPR